MHWHVLAAEYLCIFVDRNFKNCKLNSNRRQQTSPRVRNLAMPPGESRWVIRYVADSYRVSVFGPLCDQNDGIRKTGST